MDSDQAMAIVTHAAAELKLPISSDSIEALGEQFSSLNTKGSGGTITPPVIGSTASSHAAIVELSSYVTFSAVPLTGNVSTVMELVVRTTTAAQKEVVTTIVVLPWIIDSTSDLQPFLRLHHMVMDAKPEMVHALYHQLLVISDVHDIQIHQIQFIVRIISATKPLWVIDLIAPIGFSAAHINSHFFGNAAGSTTTIEFDGIPTQVLGGYGISGAALPGFSHPPLSWTNLPVSKNIPLRFLADMMTRMGCDPQGVTPRQQKPSGSTIIESKSPLHGGTNVHLPKSDIPQILP